jgi:hypothetical protein
MTTKEEDETAAFLIAMRQVVVAFENGDEEQKIKALNELMELVKQAKIGRDNHDI